MSELHALTGAHAVDGLDDVERAGFERHLAFCEDCSAEVDGLREAAALLAADVAVTPPPALRDRVLADIATVRPIPPAVAPARARRRLRPGRWLPLLVAASVLAVLGAGAAVWHPWRDAAPPPTAAERVLAAADAQRVTLDFPDGSSATLVRSVSQGRAVLTTTKMAPPPTGTVYELWLQHPDGHMAPAGLMPPTPDQTVLLEGDAAGAVGAGITVEPEGGSDQPTSDPIALFDFSVAT